MKVDYRTLSGARSVAYLNDIRVDDVVTGTDKYTDEDVSLRWDGNGWTEID